MHALCFAYMFTLLTFSKGERNLEGEKL